LIDWVRGENPPDFLVQQFTDSTGTFNRQLYDATIMDPKNKAIMARVEDALRMQRLREKLQSVVTAVVQVDESEVRQRYTDQNIMYDLDVAYFDPNVLIADNEITTTDNGLVSYYKEHSDEYKVEATRRLKYVRFDEKPSQADSEDIYNTLMDVKKRVDAGSDFKELATTYSETPSTDSYFKHGELPPDKERALFGSGKKGDMIGPVLLSDGYHLLKIVDLRPGTEEAVHVSHILIKIDPSNRDSALKQADQIFAIAKIGDNFSELAKKHSKDEASAVVGGDLGWIRKGRMVKSFEDAAFKAKPGEVVGPILTTFGYHIIKVYGKDKSEVQFNDIHMQVLPTAKSRNDIAQRAQDFAYLAKEGKFEKEAELSKYEVIETQPFQKGASISGIGPNNAINKFAFSNKTGSVSEVYTLTDAMGVFMVSEIKDAGVRPFEEVKTAIATKVMREKKIEKLKNIAQQLRSSLSPTDTLYVLKAKNPKVTVQSATSYTFAGYLPGIGRDLSLIGGITPLQPGQVSNLIESQRGIYIVKLINKTPFDTLSYKTQEAALRSQLLTERRNRYFTEWSNAIKKEADIVDNRDQFYR
jgi:peptidyl-prolyl cis-trans isomerase D